MQLIKLNFGKLMRNLILEISVLLLITAGAIFGSIGGLSATNVVNVNAIEDTTITNPDTVAQNCVNSYGLDTRINSTGNGNGISIVDLLKPARFLPIVPQSNCGAAKDGSVQPLPLGVFGIVVIRLFGFISGLIFYLVTAVLIVSGVMFIWDGIDGQQAAQAKKNIFDAVYAMLIVVGAYVIINTILILVGVNSEIRQGDLGTFFGLPTKN